MSLDVTGHGDLVMVMIMIFWCLHWNHWSAPIAVFALVEAAAMSFVEIHSAAHIHSPCWHLLVVLVLA